ncbi:MAG: two-component system, OmpR family, sensor kinase [Actinomycetota bacterium]|nr:two-component system, OmpR family, sensor kinase [Actinomycetota bacterium]
MVSGAVGELFHVTGDAAVIVDTAGTVVAWSPGAASLFGISREVALAPGAAPLVEHIPSLLALPADGGAHRRPLPPYGVLEVRHRTVGEHHLLLMRDVSDEVRRSEGLRAMSRLSRELLALETPSLEAALATVAAEAKSMTGAGTSLVMLLRPGSLGETTHFVCDGPDDLFPDGPPRFFGLLSTPVRTKRVVRLADVKDAPDGLGLPGSRLAVGPLCAVPLLAGSEVLGLLAIISPPGARVFDALDEELLVDLAGHTAVSVRWAQGAEKEAERVRQRREIISTARHDIRTPLGAGKGYSSMLLTMRDRMSPEQITSAVQGLQQAFVRIEQMTEQLLMDEQLESAGAEPHWAMVALAPLFDEVRRDAAVVTGRPDSVAVVFDPSAPAEIAGDPAMVREVVDNLVGNAIKYGGEHGPVMITVGADGQMARIDVRDEGPGIEPAEQAQLFERWTRTESTRGGTAKGFGLGLSIVKRLVAAHGGDVGVESKAGAGATFWVTFPIELPG